MFAHMRYMPPASLVATFQRRMVIGTLVSSDAAYISKAHYAVAKFAAANDKVLQNLDMIRNNSQVCLLRRLALAPSTGVLRHPPTGRWRRLERVRCRTRGIQMLPSFCWLSSCMCQAPWCPFNFRDWCCWPRQSQCWW